MPPKTSTKKPPRRLGLTVENLGYHLHPQFEERSRPPLPEPEWNAPPIDLSDASPSPSLEVTPSPEESDPDLPKTKRPGYAGFKVPRFVSERVSDDDEIPEGHIRPTTFTSSGQSARWDGYGSSQKRSRDAIEEEKNDNNPFGMLGSSQVSQNQQKRLKTYKHHNIHAAAPSPKRSKNITKSVAKKVDGGFRVPDAAAALAKLDELSKAKKGEGWKAPPKLCAPKASNKGARRSSRNQPLHEPPEDNFKIPPAVPPRLKFPSDSKDDGAFIVPPAIPPTRAETVLRETFKVPAYLTEAAPALNLTNLTSAAKEFLVRQSTTSSYPSLTTASKSSISSLSSPPSSPILLLNAPSPDGDPQVPSSASKPTSLCPVCETPVPTTSLASFTDLHAKKPSARLTYRQQARFCRTHRTANAHKTWHARGYPTIDWAGLPARLAQHHDFVLGIIKARIPSYYRTKLERKVATGTNRTVVQTFQREGEDGGAEMGYYGSRGAGIMMEYLIERYAKQLRRLAGEDKVVAAGGGLSGFVQKVLVPEVVIRFVKEDMGIEDEEAARVVLKESMDLGGLLCEEEEEVVEGEMTQQVGYGE